MNTLNNHMNQDFIIDFKRSLKNMAQRDRWAARRAKVLEWVILHNMTYKQISEELGVCVERVRSLYIKAIWRDFLNLPENRDLKYLRDRQYYRNNN